MKFIDVFKKKNISLFNSYDVKKIFNVKSTNTLKQLLRRLTNDRVIRSLVKGKYLFLYSPKERSDFATANFLITPSYISLESALSYYGLLDQFPYQITSITVQKTKTIKTNGKVFTYAKIAKKFFCDYVKIDDFLIASKEKAIFDYFYFASKGLRSKHMINELLGKIGKSRQIKLYLFQRANLNFKNFLNRYAKL